MLKPFPICQIIPPHILNNIVERGKKEQRARAMQSLTLSARIRGQRFPARASEAKAVNR